MKEAVERQRKSLKKRQSGKLLFLQMFNLEFIYWLFGLYDCFSQLYYDHCLPDLFLTQEFSDGEFLDL